MTGGCSYWHEVIDHLQFVSLLQLLPEFTDDDHVHLGKVKVLVPGYLPARMQQLVPWVPKIVSDPHADCEMKVDEVSSDILATL